MSVHAILLLHSHFTNRGGLKTVLEATRFPWKNLEKLDACHLEAVTENCELEDVLSSALQFWAG